MPKVSTHRFKLKGEEIEIPFYYTSTKGFFAKGIPQDIRSVTETFYEANDSEDELYRKLEDGFKKYHDFIATSRKVIGYRVHLSTDLLMNKTGLGSWQGTQSWVPKSFSRRGSINDRMPFGYGFVINWEIWMEVSGEDKQYHPINADGTLGHPEHRIEEKYEIIDWTPDRERAFQNIDEALTNMVKKLAETLGHKDKLIEAIDAGRLIGLGSG